jgi:hypothetical protein
LSHAPTEPNCLNCEAELHGAYCHACGQKAVARNLSVHDFAHEATHEFLHLDGKILKTVKLLVFEPGQLTKEFVEGRRARYISPLRVYLTFSLIFFFLAAIAPRGEGVIHVGTKRGSAAANPAEDERIADEIGREVQKQLPRLMFIVMPAFGLLTLLFYRRRQRYYVPHLYFSVHLHAFVFLLLSIVALAGLAGAMGKTIGSALFFAVIPYHYVALKRFFDESWPRTILKGTALGIAYVVIIAAALGALAAYTISKAT